MELLTTTACTLPTAARPLRLAEFDDLFADCAVAVERDEDAVRVRLSGVAGLGERVRDLARRESECCSFFSFTLDGEDDDLTLVISVTPEHREILDALAARAAELSS
ncbi:MAG: hypothetical protein JWO11_4172 [Nocardioides sp.]|nr:hypothetical protein [Nocardioides sp.]